MDLGMQCKGSDTGDIKQLRPGPSCMGKLSAQESSDKIKLFESLPISY